jgi:hypothetical protein
MSGIQIKSNSRNRRIPVSILKVGGIFVHKTVSEPSRENSQPGTESVMPIRPLSPDLQADIEQLTHEIHEAVDAEIGELATNLITIDDAHLFGDNEFKIRALAHKIAAKAVERHLARKKTATKGPQ